MLLLGRLVASEVRTQPMSVDVGFVLDEMDLEQVFRIPFQVFPLNIVYQRSIVIHFSIAHDKLELLFAFKRKTWKRQIARRRSH